MLNLVRRFSRLLVLVLVFFLIVLPGLSHLLIAFVFFTCNLSPSRAASADPARLDWLCRDARNACSIAVLAPMRMAGTSNTSTIASHGTLLVGVKAAAFAVGSCARRRINACSLRTSQTDEAWSAKNTRGVEDGCVRRLAHSA